MPHAGSNFVSLKHLQLDEGLSVDSSVIHVFSDTTAVLTTIYLSIFAQLPVDLR